MNQKTLLFVAGTGIVAYALFMADKASAGNTFAEEGFFGRLGTSIRNIFD